MFVDAVVAIFGYTVWRVYNECMTGKIQNAVAGPSNRKNKKTNIRIPNMCFAVQKQMSFTSAYLMYPPFRYIQLNSMAWYM